MTHGLRSEYADPAHSPGLALWQVTNAWQRRVRAALVPHDLTHVQFVLLATVVWHDGEAGLTQRELASLAGTDPMMTSQVVRSLAAKGLVTRSAHPQDGRAAAVAPTGAGVERANRANADVEAADAEFFGVLGVAERVELTRMLGGLAGH